MIQATTTEQNVDGGGAPATAVDKTESAGHDGASTTVRLPAARKKGVHSGFPVESNTKTQLARCARSRRSWNKLCQNGGGTTVTANARQSSDDGDWKTEEETGEKWRR